MFWYLYIIDRVFVCCCVVPSQNLRKGPKGRMAIVGPLGLRCQLKAVTLAFAGRRLAYMLVCNNSSIWRPVHLLLICRFYHTRKMSGLCAVFSRAVAFGWNVGLRLECGLWLEWLPLVGMVAFGLEWWPSVGMVALCWNDGFRLEWQPLVRVVNFGWNGSSWLECWPSVGMVAFG